MSNIFKVNKNKLAKWMAEILPELANNESETAWFELFRDYDEGRTYSVVMTQRDSEDEEIGNEVVAKVASIADNSGMSEYDIDFEMPYDEKTGNVWDTELSIAPVSDIDGGKTSVSYVKGDSDWLADQAEKIFKFIKKTHKSAELEDLQESVCRPRGRMLKEDVDKKYELTDETTEFCCRTLHRIKALKDFGNVKAGDLGGWIKSENNLSQDGNCWVYDEAKVFDNAKVYGNAKVRGRAKVYGNAKVYGYAEVYEEAEVYGNAEVKDSAEVYGEARVHNDATVCESARVHGNAHIRDREYVRRWVESFDNRGARGRMLREKNEDFGYNMVTAMWTGKLIAYETVLNLMRDYEGEELYNKVKEIAEHTRTEVEKHQ